MRKRRLERHLQFKINQKIESDLETEVIMTHAFNAQSLLFGGGTPGPAGTGQR